MTLRNIAIIAHVDHGKTTLVDELLKQSGAFRENQATAERMMDSNDLERERGITILAKATSVEWKDARINIVDTPGHADFGGEVERILSMVDGVVLLVDAAEGPADPYLGRILTGRVESGTLKAGETIKALSRNGDKLEQFRVTKVLAFRGLGQQPIDAAEAGDIVTLAGMSKATVADTLCALEVDIALPAQPIDPPTISVTFGINDSPLAGRDGSKVQSRVIRERLMKEAESNVAIKITDTPGGEAFEVAGRGELQLAVLIETMRREGFELSISRPRVLMRDEGGQRLEPMEEVTIDVDDEYSGAVIEKITGARKGELTEMKPAGAGKTRIIARVPSCAPLARMTL